MADQPSKLPAPSGPATAVGLALIGVAVLFAALVDLSEDIFTPRLPSVDVLAGLFVGAFFVDRLLTFIPPRPVREEAKERAADIELLRFGYGAAIGALFVSLTDLRAVAVLAEGSDVAPGVDRAIAALVIAGGIAGLTRLLDGLNPKTKTDATGTAAAAESDADRSTKLKLRLRAASGDAPTDDAVEPPPTRNAYLVGLGGLIAAALLALISLGDEDGGAVLIGMESGIDDVVVRLGLVLLAAGIVEQLVERSLGNRVTGADKPLITGAAAVFLGVAAARLLDLYLLHNLGFFGLSDATAIGVSNEIADGPGAERWLDTLVTGLVIGAGTAAIHDLGARLRKAKKPDATTTGAAVAGVVQPGRHGGGSPDA